MVLIPGWSRDDNPSKYSRRCKKLSTRPVEKEMDHCAVSPICSLWLGDDSRSIQSSSTASQSRYWCRDLYSGCNSVPISMGRRRLGRTQIVNVEMRSCRPLWADDRQTGSCATGTALKGWVGRYGVKIAPTFRVSRPDWYARTHAGEMEVFQPSGSKRSRTLLLWFGCLFFHYVITLF